ncbi:TIGR02285 family protein [Alteromonas sp. ASW11-36]|uniref:TIGR02285 family protein n=1 Tax=Alteromonas arenosi TaxID=3055817 RepID=A0ABT7T196_9ALTE|nr:TIGR02285 family protein [Alteromonas sp. ASW11-36]MDM7862224.1 TIGR02285 family protein [Alteromonas sp. ASW11-36]
MRFFVVVILTCCAVTTSGVNADSAKVINWQTFHVPPLYMKVGERIGEGFVDKMLALIIEGLPDYQHNMPLTTQARALYDIQLGKQACHPALFKTAERQKFAVFSTPAFFTPSNRLIINAGVADTRQLSSPINLLHTLENQDISLALVQGRSYGPFIDQIIANYPTENILRISVERNEVVFQLVNIQRVDATIAYPFELNYYSREAMAESNLKSFVILDSPAYSLGHVACPNNAWGKAVIARVNNSLKDLVATPEYLQAMTTWWQAEAQEPMFVEFYNAEFLAAYKNNPTKSQYEH